MLLHGYMDESYGGPENLFTFSCLLATGKVWNDVTRTWKLHLAAVNKKLKKQGRPLISRYHASDCSGRRNEFEGWSKDERDQFVLGLFGIFKRFRLQSIGYVTQIDDLNEVFDDWPDDPLKTAYTVLTKFTVSMISHDCSGLRSPKITLFHDYTADGRYDTAILNAFMQIRNDPNFRFASYFTTIAPLSWEDCVPLQPADLVAFEVFKEAEAQERARKSRKSLEALIKLETFGIHVKNFKKEQMLGLKNFMLHRRKL